MEYISIEKEHIPFNFSITLGTELFSFDVFYNQREDLFTVNLYNSENEVLVKGEPLIYGVPLFVDCWDLDFPILQLVPKDEMLEIGDINFDNFNVKVLLAVEDV